MDRSTAYRRSEWKREFPSLAKYRFGAGKLKQLAAWRAAEIGPSSGGRAPDRPENWAKFTLDKRTPGVCPIYEERLPRLEVRLPVRSGLAASLLSQTIQWFLVRYKQAAIGTLRRSTTYTLYWEPYRLSLEQWVPNCRIVYDKFHKRMAGFEVITEVIS
jgi:hypothetical protein